MPNHPQYQPGDLIGGRYRVMRPALLGGMSEVYLCLHNERRVPRALKTFQTDLPYQMDSVQRSFEREVRHWIQLEKHPNIVRCHLMQFYDDRPFIIMEWISGEPGRDADLRSWIEDDGALSMQDTLTFAIDICRGMVYAQEKIPGIVHRDLKPENILIAEGGLAKITDFGLAGLAADSGMMLIADPDAEAPSPGIRYSLQTTEGSVGTPAYMAPGQWRGDPPDQRDDIYAIGCLIYEMLTGVLAFDVELKKDWMHAYQRLHCEGERPHLPHHLPDEIDHILQQCIAADIDERFKTIGQLLEALLAAYELVCRMPVPGTYDTGAFTVSDYINRGLTYLNLERYEEAFKNFDHAVRIAPDKAETTYRRGVIYARLGKEHKAIADYSSAIAIDPGFTKAYLKRGNAYSRIGETEEALRDYKQVIRFDPVSALAYYNRGRLYHQIGQPELALGDLDTAIIIDPENARTYKLRADIYSDAKRYGAARADYNTAIDIDPDFMNAFLMRGQLSETCGQPDDALDDYAHAIELDLTNPHPYLSAGSLLYNLERYSEALLYLKHTVEMGEDESAVALIDEIEDLIGEGEKTRWYAPLSRLIAVLVSGEESSED